MIKFKDSDIGKQATTFLRKRYDFVTEKVNATPISYFVLPQELNPELPDFAFRMTGDSEIYLLGVSESVNPKFRKFVAFHEFAEFMEIGDICGRCLEASEREVKAVEKSDLSGMEKAEYFIMRRDFFKNLIDYAKGISSANEEIAEFEKSRRFFKKVCFMG